MKVRMMAMTILVLLTLTCVISKTSTATPATTTKGKRITPVNGELLIIVDPIDAQVLVDGKLIVDDAKATTRGKPVVATSQKSVLVALGGHDVTVSRDGFESETRHIEVRAKARMKLTFTLAALRRAKPADAPIPAQKGLSEAVPSAARMSAVGTSETKHAAVPALPPEKADTSKSSFEWHWVFLGVGAALVAGGGVCSWLAESDRGTVQDAKNPGGVVTEVTRSHALSLQSSANSKTRTSWALYGIGGASVLTGIVLWVLHDEAQSSSASQPVDIAATPLPGGGFISLGGSF